MTKPTKTALYYFKTDPEIYSKYVLGKYKCFVTQLYNFLKDISNNPNTTYTYGNGKKDMLITNFNDSSIEEFNHNLIECGNELAQGFDKEMDYIVDHKYTIPTIIDFSEFTINAVDSNFNKVSNKKRANKLFKNFYNADNTSGLKDFIETALFKNGINHTFVSTTYNINDEVGVTYHLADNIDMSISVLIPDANIKNEDASKEYFTTMRVYCSLSIVGYRSCMIGMMN